MRMESIFLNILFNMTFWHSAWNMCQKISINELVHFRIKTSVNAGKVRRGSAFAQKNVKTLHGLTHLMSSHATWLTRGLTPVLYHAVPIYLFHYVNRQTNVQQPSEVTLFSESEY